MSVKFDKISKALADNKTILGVGPMSMLCIDTTIEVANEHEVPIQMICSRRQIECKELGGGYVWDTESLAKYVKEKDKGDFIFLTRDHGGPWQGRNEKDLDHHDAMVGAMMSYLSDIKSGFDILHIDPSLGGRTFEEIIEDVDCLYHYCEATCDALGQNVIYEVGTEEHGGHITDIEKFKEFVYLMENYEKVMFVVGNMGLHVKEMENVGIFVEDEARALVEVCDSEGFCLKGHNTDYVTPDVLQKMNELGVHSVNVAPEFGVLETIELLKYLQKHDPDAEKKFISIAAASGKWEKWMLYNTMSKAHDAGCEVDPTYKALICGHYNFAFLKDVRTAESTAKIKEELEKRIKYYLTNLGWDV